jgi:hypothetical protein
LFLKRLRVFLNYLYWYPTHPGEAWKMLKAITLRTYSWGLDRMNQNHYPHHTSSIEALRARRTSDTIFIFGAGTSLSEVTPEEWAHIDTHNTLGWHLFTQQDFVHADIYIFRELHSQDFGGRVAEMRKHVEDTNRSPHFKNTLWAVQAGWTAINGNLLVGYKLLRPNTPILRFHNSRRGSDALPTETFEQGIVHGSGTLTDAVNLAYLGGWKKIVLIGVDLYDTKYFTRGPWDDDPQWVAANPDSNVLHPTTRHGIIDQLGAWVPWLNERGVEIRVYNPRSLMTQVMPVYERKP